VTFWFANASAGPDLLIARSAEAAPVTTVTAGKLLFSELGSGVALEIVAMLVKTVPAAVPPGICATSVMVALAPDAKVGIVQVTVPLFPTPGSVQAQPAGADTLTKVRVAGSGSVTDTDVASAEPETLNADSE
jgi:hypothetical protein